MYREIKNKTLRNYNLRCIDGSVHGCSKCVGYCSYDGHSGFLTAEQQAGHQCIEKGCFYYHPKPATPKRTHDNSSSLLQKVFSIAQVATAEMEGLRVIRVEPGPSAGYTVYYVAIAKYDILPVAKEVTTATERQIIMQQIPCNFDVAVSLVMT